MEDGEEAWALKIDANKISVFKLSDELLFLFSLMPSFTEFVEH